MGRVGSTHGEGVEAPGRGVAVDPTSSDSTVYGRVFVAASVETLAATGTADKGPSATDAPQAVVPGVRGGPPPLPTSLAAAGATTAAPLAAADSVSVRAAASTPVTRASKKPQPVAAARAGKSTAASDGA